MTNFTFGGFEEANTTPVPDVLFDELLPKLSGPQLKVLLYIIRRTAGFKKSSDGISLSQFTDGIKTRDGKVLDNGCGIKKRSSVSKVLRELIAMGCVESAKAKTEMGDDAVTTYSVRFKGVGAKLALPSDEMSTTVVPNQPLPGSAQIGTRGSAQIGTHKKQLTRNSNKQETDLQGVTYDSAIATSSPALTENDEVLISGHDYSLNHLDVSCAQWRAGNQGRTCQDFQAAIEETKNSITLVELAWREQPYVPELNYLTSEHEAAPLVQIVEHETLLRATGNLIEKNKAISAALSEQESPIALPVGAASGYEKKEDEDGSTDVSACRTGGTGSLPDSAPVANQRSAQRTGHTEKAEQTTLIVEKKPMTLEAQIDAAYKVLDHVRQKLTEDPTKSYVQYKNARKALKDLIESCAGTPNEVNTKNITLAYTAMWNEGPWTSGKSWSDPGMLTVPKFCEHYEKYLEIGRAATAPKPTANKPDRGVSGLGKWVPPTGMQAALAQQGDRR